MKVLIGTKSQDKYKEYKNIFNMRGCGIELVDLAQTGVKDDVEEDADNLLDNAKKKAEFFGRKSGLVTIADDTGLFVDALNGKPGIYAKRWHAGSDYDRNVKLLELLKNIPEEKRTARYIGVIAAYNPATNAFWTYEGRVEGLIVNEFRGKGGFGYDPIFKVVSIKKHYAELTEEELFQIGHRGRGIKELFDADFLKK